MRLISDRSAALRAVSVFGLSLAVFLSPAMALGQSRASDVAAAEALFQEGIKLMRDGKNEQACPKLAESQKLDPAVGTLLYLGECYERTGQLASAWATFKLAAAEGRKSNEEERVKMAAERADALESRIPRLTIDVPAGARARGMVVRRDGTEVGEGSWGVAVPVDPGVHVVSISAPGKVTRNRSITVKSGTVSFSAEPLEDAVEEEGEQAPAAGAKPAPVAPVDRGTESGSSQRTWGLVAGGVGVLGIGAGVVFAMQGKARESESEDYCRPDAPSIYSQRGLDLLDEADQKNKVSLIAFGVGGVALVTGAVLYLTAPSDSGGSARVQVVPVVAQEGGGLSAVGVW